MSTTSTFGRHLLNAAMPAGYSIEGPTGKKALNKSMSELAHKDAHVYVRTIAALKKIGDRLATSEGLSVGLDDIEPDYKARDAALKPHLQRFNAATSDERKREIVEAAQVDVLKHVSSHPGTMTQQFRSGARGSPIQYMKIVGSPVYARNAAGKTEPWMIHRSYSEGLKPSDYWVAGNEAILDTIKSTVSVSEPGELAKILVSNMQNIIVTEDDCGTSNGILMPADHSDVVDRFLARDTGGFKKGTLVTPAVQSKLSHLQGKILVRSPMTCEAGDGVCQKCQGLDEKGQLHVHGTNVGVRAAQAMSEPLTQFALSAKHGVMTVKGARAQVHGVQGFRQIIQTPHQFINKATLAERDGKVSKIEVAPQGGHYVYIDDHQHYINPNLDVTVAPGQVMERGDALSQGVPKPDEVVNHKGLAAGRLYVVNTLKNLYKDQGQDLDSRHFELLARGEMNHVQILNDPSNTFLKGDVVSYNALKSALKHGVKTVPLTDALGETLGKEYFHYSAGMRVTPAVVKFLKSQKLSEVTVAPRAPEVQFIMKPATTSPLLDPDWMARLAHRDLKSSILQAAQFGEISDIHGTSPVPAYALSSTEFGKGPKGRY
jgi:DNA-directed RNA polymerase subunit beta'